MSCQPRPHPQASGMAASSASIGTATKAPIRIRSPVPLRSGSTSGRVWLGAGGASAAAPGLPMSAEVAMAVPRLASAVAARWSALLTYRVWGQCRYAYVTVGYGAVGYASTMEKFFQTCGEAHTVGTHAV